MRIWLCIWYMQTHTQTVVTDYGISFVNKICIISKGVMDCKIKETRCWTEEMITFYAFFTYFHIWSKKFPNFSQACTLVLTHMGWHTNVKNEGDLDTRLSSLSAKWTRGFPCICYAMPIFSSLSPVFFNQCSLCQNSAKFQYRYQTSW